MGNFTEEIEENKRFAMKDATVHNNGNLKWTYSSSSITNFQEKMLQFNQVYAV